MIVGFFAIIIGMIGLICMGFFYGIVVPIFGLILSIFDKEGDDKEKEVSDMKYLIVDIKDKCKVLASSNDYIEAQAKKWDYRNKGYIVMIKEIKEDEC